MSINRHLVFTETRGAMSNVSALAGHILALLDRPGRSNMQMAIVLATMPDLWQRVLIDHAEDVYGYCLGCRTGDGVAAEWPCLPWRIAQEAQNIYYGLPTPELPVIPEPRQSPPPY